ncbi:MAG: flotillin family protein [Candidatus Sumerlaeia bacterium]
MSELIARPGRTVLMAGFLSLREILGEFTVPFLVLIGLFAVIALLVALNRLYIRVPPNRAAFFYGSVGGLLSGKGRRHVEVVTGGSKLRIPFFQEVAWLDLTELTIPDLKVVDVPNVDGILVTVDAVANVKFQNDERSLMAAGERFLGKSQQELKNFVLSTLEANLRGICGNMKIDEMIRNRHRFQAEVMEEAGKALSVVGMQVDILNIQNITDKRGYINALGRGPTAEVVRDAEIAEALALRESKIKATNAHREAEVVAQENLKQEAEAQKNTQVAIAQFKASTEAEMAKAAQAGPLSDAIARQQVTRELVKIEEVKAQAEIGVQEQLIQREQKSQEAQTVVPAKAAADAMVKRAEGQKQSDILTADGQKYKQIALAEAQKEQLALEGSGKAAQMKAIGEAEGSAIRARGEGEAAAIKAKGEAEGARIFAELKARAEGLEKIAQAYAKLPDKGYALEMLKLLPPVIEGAAEVFAAISSPLGNIQKLTVYDSGRSGGGDGPGQNALNRFASITPTVFFDFLQQLRALGIDVNALLKKAGVTVEELEQEAAARNSADSSKPLEVRRKDDAGQAES